MVVASVVVASVVVIVGVLGVEKAIGAAEMASAWMITVRVEVEVRPF